MYMLPFLLLTIVGAWLAWRQNPMYTLGRTVRFILVFGLTVATVIVALLSVIHLTAGKSQTVQLASIFGLIAVSTLGLIGLIIQMSLPASAAMPKGVKLVRFHRAKVDVWARRAGWTLLAMALLAVVLPTPGKIIAGTLGGFVAFLSLVMLFAGYISARKMDQWLTEIELRPWVHWTYTTEQWAAWNAERVQAAPLKAAPPEVYFGSEGLFVDATFWPWISAGIYLISATKATGEPAHLDFEFMKIEAGSSTSIVHQGVLLPANATADVEKLQTELKAKCSTAVIHLV